MSELSHRSVLLNEAISSLNINPDGTYIDATFGRGGYSKEILKRIKNGRLIGIDRDQEAILYGQKSYEKEIKDNRLILVQANYKNIAETISQVSQTPIDGIVFDLGVSSPQFDDPGRGFSYRFKGPLDMRMDQTQILNAADVVNKYSPKELTDIFKHYGDAPLPARVAAAIVKRRAYKPIDTTTDLVEIIESSLPEKIKRKKGHPAKKYFQALRIEVNDEYKSLKNGLEKSLQILKIGGLISVVTFQPLEDKLVSRTFRSLANFQPYPKGIPIIPDEAKPRIDLIPKHAIRPSAEELENNRRAHSARLRTARKVRKINFR